MRNQLKVNQQQRNTKEPLAFLYVTRSHKLTTAWRTPACGSCSVYWSALSVCHQCHFDSPPSNNLFMFSIKISTSSRHVNIQEIYSGPRLAVRLFHGDALVFLTRTKDAAMSGSPVFLLYAHMDLFWKIRFIPQYNIYFLYLRKASIWFGDIQSVILHLSCWNISRCRSKMTTNIMQMSDIT